MFYLNQLKVIFNHHSTLPFNASLLPIVLKWLSIACSCVSYSASLCQSIWSPVWPGPFILSASTPYLPSRSFPAASQSLLLPCLCFSCFFQECSIYLGKTYPYCKFQHCQLLSSSSSSSQLFIECLLCSRNCSKCMRWINSFNPLNNALMQVLLLTPFLQMWKRETLNNLVQGRLTSMCWNGDAAYHLASELVLFKFYVLNPPTC